MRWQHVLTGVKCCLASLLLLSGVNAAYAETRYHLHLPGHDDLLLARVDQKRENNTLVLFTSAYGAFTRTNPYGTEVALLPVPGSLTQYKVSKIAAASECQKLGATVKCGNMAIPEKGVVLSANGTQQALLSGLSEGTTIELIPVLIYESRLRVNAVNPTAQTNPPGSGFPGFRGGNQMLVYDKNYGQPSTGTNEFGYEVTVRNERVVEQQGANSLIPTDDGAYILSGHGIARQWLLWNAPIGSRIKRENDVVVSLVDKDTYLYQLDQMVAKVRHLKPTAIPTDLIKRVDALKNEAYTLSEQGLAERAVALQKELTPILWASYAAVDPKTTRAIWHRPSEGTLAEIRQSLDMIKRSGFNTIFLETYLHGTPIFPAKTFGKYDIPVKLPFAVKGLPANKDLMDTWLAEAHQRGLKVHVWFQTFYAGNRQYDNSVGQIILKHPTWANVQRSGLTATALPPSTLEPGGFFLDPANPEVQSFLLDLIDEIVTRYPVDGFQLDYIRYPSSFPPDRYSYVATTWGYTTAARQQFQAKTGQDPATLTPADNPDLWAQWNAFKTQQVSTFVAQAQQRIKSRKPNLPVSAAVFPKINESLSRKHQDWLSWARAGELDFLAPMTLTSSLQTIADDTRIMQDQTRLPIITGIFGPFNGNSPSDVVEQVWTAFQAGAKGVSLFDTAHLSQPMGEALSDGIFKIPPPPAPQAVIRPAPPRPPIHKKKHRWFLK